MSKQIRVLQLIDSLNVGGAEVLAVNIFNLLEKYGIQSFLCATREEGVLNTKIRKRENYLFLNRQKTIDFKAILKLRKFILDNKINIIHAHSSSYFIAFCLKLILRRVKIVWHDHYGKSDFLSERKKTPLNIISNSFSHIVCVNSKLKDWAIDVLKFKETTFVNNFPYFNDSSLITKLKGDYGKRVVCLAAFRPQKNHLNLLEAFKMVVEKYPDWTLHIIGKGVNDEYESKIYRFVKENNLENSVFFYGVCSDIKNILEQSTIGVLSSDSEGLPVALLEYGLAKLTVVVTDVGECSKVIKNKTSGIVVSPKDSKALFEGLQELIENKNKREEFAEILHINVVNNYSSTSFIKKLNRIYKSIV